MRVVRCLILVVVFPCLMSLVVYEGFGTNYTGGVFHEQGFKWQYEHGISRFRVLGRVSMLETYHFMRSKNPAAKYVRANLGGPPASVKANDPAWNRAFYDAYLVQNTVFWILGAVLLWLILWRQPGATWASVCTRHMLSTLLVCLTQYVVTPYDTLTYALLLLSLFLILHPSRYSFPCLLLAIVVGTLTRETSALVLSFYAAHHYRRLLARDRRALAELALLTLAFVATYVLLRVHYGTDQAVLLGLRAALNFGDPYGRVGVATLVAVSFLLCTANVDRCLAFVVTAAPYWIAMLFIAATWELRLWVPIWLCLIVLAGEAPSEGQPAPSP